MTFPVYIKCPDRDKTAWQEILNVLQNSGIKCSKLDSTNNGFKALMLSQDDAEKLFNSEVLALLSDIRCTPSTPIYLKTNRTIVVKNVDRFIMDHSEDEILENINLLNARNFSVTKVHKFPSGKTFKMEFKTAKMVEYCLESGFFLFNLSISPKFLALEDNPQIFYCYRCYGINNHKSNSCLKPKSYKVCSLCASEEHSHVDCNSTERKCINCDGNHATISKTCPRFKEVVESMPKMNSTTDNRSIVIKASVQKQQTSLDGKTSHSSMPANYCPKNSIGDCTLSNEDMFRGYMCLMMASQMEAESFQNNLSTLLLANNLPSFNTAGLTFSQSCGQKTSSLVENLSLDMSANGINPKNSASIEDTVCSKSVSDCIGDFEKNGNVTGSGTIDKVFQPSKHSTVFNDRTTRSQSRPCIIYVRQTMKIKLSKGSILTKSINSRDVAIDHNCQDETYCMQTLSKKIHQGDHTNLKIEELTHRKFDEKYKILMNSID